MTAIWHILSNTPWWVYLIFLYLFYVSFRATRPRIVSIKKLAIIPILFTVISLHTLFTAITPNVLTITCWVAAVLLGSFFGWFLILRIKAKFDKSRALIQIPGSWLTMVIIILIFISKYSFGYELGIDPKLLEDTWFEIGMLGISGFCTGLFIGRFACFLYRMQIEPHTDFIEKIPKEN